MKSIPRSRAPHCAICHRPVGSTGELVARRPNGTRIALCGRQACTDRYNDDPLPAPARVNAEATEAR